MFLCTIGGWLSLGYVLYALHIWFEHSSQKHPSNTRKKRCVLFICVSSEWTCECSRCSVCGCGACPLLGTGISGFLCVHNVYSVFPLCSPAVSTKQCYVKSTCLTASSVQVCARERNQPHTVRRFYWTGFYLTAGHLLILSGNTLTPQEYDANGLNC